MYIGTCISHWLNTALSPVLPIQDSATMITQIFQIDHNHATLLINLEAPQLPRETYNCRGFQNQN